MKSYIFNHDYILRHDEKRTYLVQKYLKNDSSFGWISKIHPIQAMILSFFSESKSLEKAKDELAFFLDEGTEEVGKMLEPFIENKESFYTEYSSHKYKFPKNILIEASANKSPVNSYNAEDFRFEELDFVSKRFYSGPLNMTFMPNNVCATNCIYCYADKSHNIKNYIKFERIKEIIDEAKRMNVLSFNVIGGEVFTYPYWDKLLEYLMQCGYEPERISTKVPLNHEDVIKLSRTGIKELQVSIDTLIDKNLSILLRTNKEYNRKLLDFIKFLNDEDFNINIQTILTKFNCSKEDMQSIFDYIKSLKINEWIIRPAFASIYNGNDFVPSLAEINSVFDAVEPLKSQMKISYDRTFLDRGYVTATGGSENFTGAECSSNRSHIFILPDGKVTICEQLYWKPNFIVGDLNVQSIKEVWNSEKSLWLANLGKSELSDHNPCKACEIFDSCYKNMNRCWAEVVKAYGDENWDYPDPRCKLAPEMKTNLIYQ